MARRASTNGNVASGGKVPSEKDKDDVETQRNAEGAGLRRGRGKGGRKKYDLIYVYIGMYCNSHGTSGNHLGCFQCCRGAAAAGDIELFGVAGTASGGDCDALEMEQPSVSKHLRVLKDVGLVHARRDGRQMFYRTNTAAIRPLHEWAGTFERYWQPQLIRVKERAEEKSGAVKKD
jgi:DNA-binding transcriptional ArsR family regulator